VRFPSSMDANLLFASYQAQGEYPFMFRDDDETPNVHGFNHTGYAMTCRRRSLRRQKVGKLFHHAPRPLGIGSRGLCMAVALFPCRDPLSDRVVRSMLLSSPTRSRDRHYVIAL